MKFIMENGYLRNIVIFVEMIILKYINEYNLSKYIGKIGKIIIMMIVVAMIVYTLSNYFEKEEAR